MNVSIVLLRKSHCWAEPEFLARQIRRHFETWREGFYASSFVLAWIGGLLVLTTDDLELVDRWKKIESGYIEWMVEGYPVPEQEIANVAA
jgi:hypothetical protein